MLARPMLNVVAATAIAVAVGWISSARPLQTQGGDTVPARLGAYTLDCIQSDNLGAIPWIHEKAKTRVPYNIVITASGRELVSTFGPGPARWVHWVTPSPSPGDEISRGKIVRRGRTAACIALALSTFLFALALMWLAGPFPGGILAICIAGSFAGIVTIGQDVWQQTVSLIPLCGAFLCCAGVLKAKRAAICHACVLGCMALPSLSVFLRPADAPLCLGIFLFGVASADWKTSRTRALKVIAVGVCLSLTLVAPIVFWNLENYGSLLPVGQLLSNERHGAAFSASNMAGGLAGLTVSPGRGLLWYAPVAALIPWIAFQRNARDHRKRLIAATVIWLAQICFLASFHRWWGGYGFGPRLLIALVWFSAIPVAWYWPRANKWSKWVVGKTAAWTLGIGIVGYLFYSPAHWEVRQETHAKPDGLWNLRDNPVTSILGKPNNLSGRDLPNGPFIYCDMEPLREVPKAIPPGSATAPTEAQQHKTRQN